MLIDTHTHLDHCRAPAEELLAEAENAGVGVIIQSGTDLESSRVAMSLAEKHPQVFASVGFHPQEAGLLTPEDLAGLRGLARHKRVVAVGETGFDFYHDNWPHELQEQIFVHHLELARHAGLPVVIHTRDADLDTLRVLEAHAGGLTVILHCFSLTKHVSTVIERGFYMSFAGNVTYKNALDLQEACRRIPSDRLLLETDAPYLTPVPLRGRPNRPALVAHTYEHVARLRGITPEELELQVRDNVLRAYPRLQEASAL